MKMLLNNLGYTVTKPISPVLAKTTLLSQRFNSQVTKKSSGFLARISIRPVRL